MWVIEDVRDGVHRTARHFELVALGNALGERELLRPISNPGIDLLAVAITVDDLAPLAVARYVRRAHGLGKPREDLVGRARDRDPLAVLGGVMAVRADIHGAGAHALAHITLVVVSGDQLVENTEDGLVQPDVDILPASRHVARTQRIHHAERAIEAREIIRDGRGAGCRRRSIGKSCEIGEAAERVANAAEAGARAVRSRLSET